jgi:ABC-type phosphate/phosphonate transport system permease subunit
MDEQRPAEEPTRTEIPAERPAPVQTKTRSTRKRRWGAILFGIFVILPILLIALWTTIALNWTYSRGDRAGFIQKFSQKGWVCKTWEGEIAMVNLPGATQERFAFSVRDDSVAHAITRLMGSRVSLSYEEHRGVPTRCFGETQYYVTGVKPIP